MCLCCHLPVALQLLNLPGEVHGWIHVVCTGCLVGRNRVKIKIQCLLEQSGSLFGLPGLEAFFADKVAKPPQAVPFLCPATYALLTLME